MCTSSTTRRLLVSRCACATRSIHEKRNQDHGGQDHHQGSDLRLPHPEEHRRVGPVEAEEEAPDRVKPEVENAEHAVRQLALKALVKWQEQRKQAEREEHLVAHLEMDHLAGL